MAPAPDLTQLIDVVIKDAPSSELLDQLVMASEIVSELQELSDALLGHFVEKCRNEGLTWLEISAALGVTKQAVHRRFADAVSGPRQLPSSNRSGNAKLDLDLEREFERSCRLAIAEVQRLGFIPGGWIGLIDQMGAVAATRHLFSTRTILPLFHFLVGAKRTELSVEWAVLQPEWRELFNDANREEAQSRLKVAGVER